MEPNDYVNRLRHAMEISEIPDFTRVYRTVLYLRGKFAQTGITRPI